MKRSILSILTILFSAGLLAQPGVIIDRTVAVVGGKVILLSDIENQAIQLRMQGYSGPDARCDIFEELLFQKLMLNQAEVDSIVIGDEEVEMQLDRRINYFIGQFGGDQKKMEEFYGKTITEIKEEFRELLRDQMKIDKVQQGIIDNVKVTPSEVMTFFKGFPTDSLPLIDSKYQVSHIVSTPKISFQEKEKARKKIEDFRKRITEGEDFAVLAALYSEDPGSAAKGGELGMFGRGIMAPEFEAAAFALKAKDELSPVIETEFGFHILQLIARKGDFVNVRHILVIPKISPTALLESYNFLDSVATLLKNDSMDFGDAAFRFSDADNRYNKGIIVNEADGTALFSPEDMDPALFFVVDKLEPGEFSDPIAFTTEGGKKAYRLVYLNDRTKPHRLNIDDDYDLIQQYALQNKQNKVVDEWIAQRVKDTYVKILDEKYLECQFHNDWGINSKGEKE